MGLSADDGVAEAVDVDGVAVTTSSSYLRRRDDRRPPVVLGSEA